MEQKLEVKKLMVINSDPVKKTQEKKGYRLLVEIANHCGIKDKESQLHLSVPEAKKLIADFEKRIAEIGNDICRI